LFRTKSKRGEAGLQARDYTDVIGGGLLLAFGVWFALYAGADYNLGSLRRMGPGFFPAIIGWLVAFFGLLVLVPALFRVGEMPVPKLRPLGTIMVGGLAFAFIVERFGMVPATMVLVFVSALAEERFYPVRTLVLAAALAAIAVVVFTMGLGIPIPAFRWIG
jgi:hypothetical protein